MWLGAPWYPGGFPLKKNQITAGNRTIEEIYLGCIKERGEYLADDEETLKSYIVYYVNAPIFASEFTKELTSQDLMSMSITNLIMLCLDYGLDPL